MTDFEHGAKSPSGIVPVIAHAGEYVLTPEQLKECAKRSAEGEQP